MKEDYLPIDQCKKGYLYKIDSRNLSYGVYDGKQGFIGIREKFGSKYLFTEFHYDQGAPYGTVFPEKELEKVTDGIEIKECGETVDKHTGRLVKFDTPISQGGRGWYFSDTGESSVSIFASSLENKPLFDYLTTKEIEYRLVTQ